MSNYKKYYYNNLRKVYGGADPTSILPPNEELTSKLTLPIKEPISAINDFSKEISKVSNDQNVKNYLLFKNEYNIYCLNILNCIKKIFLDLGKKTILDLYNNKFIIESDDIIYDIVYIFNNPIDSKENYEFKFKFYNNSKLLLELIINQTSPAILEIKNYLTKKNSIIKFDSKKMCGGGVFDRMSRPLALGIIRLSRTTRSPQQESKGESKGDQQDQNDLNLPLYHRISTLEKEQQEQAIDFMLDREYSSLLGTYSSGKKFQKIRAPSLDRKIIPFSESPLGRLTSSTISFISNQFNNIFGFFKRFFYPTTGLIKSSNQPNEEDEPEPEEGMTRGLPVDVFISSKIKYDKDKKGTFAVQKINAGEILFREKPLYRYSGMIEPSEIDELPEVKKSLMLELYSDPRLLDIYRQGVLYSEPKFSLDPAKTEKIANIIVNLVCNTFDNGTGKILYFGISRLNHSELPNCYLFLPKFGFNNGIVYALKDIEKDEQITIAYFQQSLEGKDKYDAFHGNNPYSIHNFQGNLLPGYQHANMYINLLIKDMQLCIQYKLIGLTLKPSGAAHDLDECINQFAMLKCSDINNCILHILIYFIDDIKRFSRLSNILYSNLKNVLSPIDVTWYYMFILFPNVEPFSEQIIDKLAQTNPEFYQKIMVAKEKSKNLSDLSAYDSDDYQSRDLLRDSTIIKANFYK